MFNAAAPDLRSGARTAGRGLVKAHQDIKTMAQIKRLEIHSVSAVLFSPPPPPPPPPHTYIHTHSLFLLLHSFPYLAVLAPLSLPLYPLSYLSLFTSPLSLLLSLSSLSSSLSVSLSLCLPPSISSLSPLLSLSSPLPPPPPSLSHQKRPCLPNRPLALL